MCVTTVGVRESSKQQHLCFYRGRTDCCLIGYSVQLWWCCSALVLGYIITITRREHAGHSSQRERTGYTSSYMAEHQTPLQRDGKSFRMALELWFLYQRFLKCKYLASTKNSSWACLQKTPHLSLSLSVTMVKKPCSSAECSVQAGRFFFHLAVLWLLGQMYSYERESSRCKRPSVPTGFRHKEKSEGQIRQ